MKTRMISFLLVAVFIGNSMNVFSQSTSQMDILQYWAPQVNQDMNESYSFFHQYYSAKDAIVKVNFDGDWDTGSNWGMSNFQVDQESQAINGIAYASFVESVNFYFLGYGFYHAGDDSNLSADRHENDWEMVVICIRKDGTIYGEFCGMVTQFHSDVNEYLASDFAFYGSHPKIYISANGNLDPLSAYEHGHGIENFTNSSYQDDFGSDAVVYLVDDFSESVTDNSVSSGWSTANRYNYKLIPVTELWNRRGNALTYDTYTRFNGGDSSVDDGGNPPWQKDFFTDPITDFASRDTYNDLDAYLSGDSYLLNPFYNNTTSQTGITNANAIVPLPDSFSEQILGDADGKVYSSGSTYLIDASGSDIWETSDNGYFLYSDSLLSGDVELNIRVYSVQDVSKWSKAGIMLRESLDDDSKNIFLLARPTLGISSQQREVTGGSCTSTRAYTSPSDDRPIYLRITRVGDVFTTYYSLDGSSFVTIATETIIMNSDLYFGMAVTSHVDASTFCSALMDNLSYTTSNSLKSTEFDELLELEMDISVFNHSILISNIKLEDKDNISFQVYNIQGRLIQCRSEKTQNSLLIELNENQKSGVYLVRILINGNIVVKKMMIK